MNIIAVDIGNSLAKVSTTAGASLVRVDLDQSISVDLDQGNKDWLADTDIDDSNHWFIVSVAPKKTDQMIALINRHHAGDQVTVVDNDLVPLRSTVKNRNALGTDRLMAAYAATQLNDSAALDPTPCIIVDAGTAVTIDLVDKDRVFCGGLIFPGIATNLTALAHNTAALPDLSQEVLKSLTHNIQTGDDTASAILNGVVQSQAWAILGITSQLAAQHQATVYCTGGGIEGMQEILPPTWHHVPDLIHRGIRAMSEKR